MQHKARRGVFHAKYFHSLPQERQAEVSTRPIEEQSSQTSNAVKSPGGHTPVPERVVTHSSEASLVEVLACPACFWARVTSPASHLRESRVAGFVPKASSVPACSSLHTPVQWAAAPE